MGTIWTLKDGTRVTLVRPVPANTLNWFVSHDAAQPDPSADMPRGTKDMWTTSVQEDHWGLVVVTEAPDAEAPKAAAILTTDKAARKSTPIATGVVDYFPRALAEIARVSKAGNDQHNPGQPLHWDKSKSTDHADCIARHLIERGTIDDDGMRHSAKLAWRALALLETELEKEAGK